MYIPHVPYVPEDCMSAVYGNAQNEANPGQLDLS